MSLKEILSKTDSTFICVGIQALFCSLVVTYMIYTSTDSFYKAIAILSFCVVCVIVSVSCYVFQNEKKIYNKYHPVSIIKYLFMIMGITTGLGLLWIPLFYLFS